MIRPLNLSVPEGVSLKDPALIRVGETYHLFCSWFYGENFSRITAWTSQDLERWDGPHWSWGDGDQGFCSPDVTQVNSQWIMTFQSWDALHPRESQNKLFYATNTDGTNWSLPQPLAPNLTRGVRAIDPAVSFNGHHWFLVYKEAQSPKMATASQLEGPWTPLPPPVDQWIENAQFIQNADHWFLYATLVNHHQGIARMVGDGRDPEHWRAWEPFHEITTQKIPGFNRTLPANAGSLWDDRNQAGSWIRVFCAADREPRSNLDFRLGIEMFDCPDPLKTL